MIRRVPAIVMFALLACQPTDGVPDSYQPVVITAILVANQPLQVFTIQWAPTQAVPDPAGGPAPADVDLWIVSPGNDSTPVVGGPLHGSFSATLTPQPGNVYRLRGTVLGVAVSASTTIPSLVINSPRDGDTVRVGMRDPRDQGPPPTFVVVFVNVKATEALGYGASGIGILNPPGLTSDGRGNLVNQLEPLLIQIGTSPAPARVTVTAFDANASFFYGVGSFFGGSVVGGSATSTISGALGVFGSNVSASVNIVVSP